MSPTIGMPMRRSAVDILFRPGGDPYLTVPRIRRSDLEGLVKDEELAAATNAANMVISYLVEAVWEKRLDALLTDEVMASDLGVSVRTIQRGLHALDVAMGRIGRSFIRRLRAAGRRIIEFVRGFAPSRSAPPAPPIKKEEITTTREVPSSSSLGEGEGEPEGREQAPPELVDRAMKLVPDATPGRVADVVQTYGVDWVRRALDEAEKKNRKAHAQGKNKVQGWAYVLGILGNWKRVDGPPPEAPPPAPPATRPAEAPAEALPAQRLTPDSLAELLERCRDRNPTRANWARRELRTALSEKLIDAELIETIPAELLADPKQRAP